MSSVPVSPVPSVRAPSPECPYDFTDVDQAPWSAEAIAAASEAQGRTGSRAFLSLPEFLRLLKRPGSPSLSFDVVESSMRSPDPRVLAALASVHERDLTRMLWLYDEAVARADACGLLWTKTLDVVADRVMRTIADTESGDTTVTVTPAGHPLPSTRVAALAPWVAAQRDFAPLTALMARSHTMETHFMVARSATCLTPAIVDDLARTWGMRPALCENPTLPVESRAAQVEWALAELAKPRQDYLLMPTQVIRASLDHGWTLTDAQRAWLMDQVTLATTDDLRRHDQRRAYTPRLDGASAILAHHGAGCSTDELAALAPILAGRWFPEVHELVTHPNADLRVWEPLVRRATSLWDADLLRAIQAHPPAARVPEIVTLILDAALNGAPDLLAGSLRYATPSDAWARLGAVVRGLGADASSPGAPDTLIAFMDAMSPAQRAVPDSDVLTALATHPAQAVRLTAILLHDVTPTGGRPAADLARIRTVTAGGP
jgi:hypothetical protein